MDTVHHGSTGLLWGGNPVLMRGQSMCHSLWTPIYNLRVRLNLFYCERFLICITILYPSLKRTPWIVCNSMQLKENCLLKVTKDLNRRMPSGKSNPTLHDIGLGLEL